MCFFFLFRNVYRNETDYCARIFFTNATVKAICVVFFPEAPDLLRGALLRFAAKTDFFHEN